VSACFAMHILEMCKLCKKEKSSLLWQNGLLYILRPEHFGDFCGLEEFIKAKRKVQAEILFCFK